MPTFKDLSCLSEYIGDDGLTERHACTGRASLCSFKGCRKSHFSCVDHSLYRRRRQLTAGGAKAHQQIRLTCGNEHVNGEREPPECDQILGRVVYRGIEGYGTSTRIRFSSYWKFSHDAPIILSIIDQEERFYRLLPHLDATVEKELIAMSRVDVIRFSRSSAKA